MSILLRNKILFRLACLFVSISFLSNTIFPGFARASDLALPNPTQLVPLSDSYSFPLLKGMKFDPSNPLNMEFIIDTANKQKVTQDEASILIKYFLAGLTIPEEELWVNMSPYEADKMITPSLSQTDLGKDLLSQDYILKQLSSSLTYPETETGKDFWLKTYQEVLKVAKTTNIPINTFNKLWIVPDKALVHENGSFAFIKQASLKAMLEQDYLALQNNISDIQKQKKDLKEELIEKVNHASSEVVRNIILPKINNEINQGKNFATLRQIYYALVLGVWFKKRFKDSIYSYYIDQGKVKGIDLQDKDAKDKIYNLYVEAFKKGVYSYTKTEKDLGTGRNLKRQYFSGGFTALSLAADTVIQEQSSSAIRNELSSIAHPAYLKITNTPEAVISAGSPVTLKGFGNLNQQEALKEAIRLLQQAAGEIEKAFKDLGILAIIDKLKSVEEIDDSSRKELYRQLIKLYGVIVKESLVKTAGLDWGEVSEIFLKNDWVEKISTTEVRFKGAWQAIESRLPEVFDKEHKKIASILQGSWSLMDSIQYNQLYDTKKVAFSGKDYISIIYDLIDKLRKIMFLWKPERAKKSVDLLVMYIKLLFDIQSPDAIDEEYAKGMKESDSQPEYTYRLLLEYVELVRKESLFTQSDEGSPPQQTSQSSPIASKTFLQDTKQAVKNLEHPQSIKPIVHVIMGNEASDLDSTVSTIAYANLKSRESIPAGEVPVLVVPLINTLQGDFRLRTEVVYWLEQLGISEDDLLFITDLYFRDLQRKGFEVRLTLVDHNKLATGQEYLKPFVTEIIDHHPNEKQFGEQVSGEFAGVGSNTTLIAERILRQNPDLLTPELAKLLLGPVVLDTVNLDETAGRVTERDRGIADTLIDKTGIDQNEIFQALQTAKFDLSRLSFREILEKDKKYYKGKHPPYIISSITGLSLQRLLTKTSNPMEGLYRMLDSFQSSLIVGMMIFEEGGTYKRELFLYSDRTNSLLPQLKAFLLSQPSLQLKELPEQPEAKNLFSGERFIAFSTSPKISRKVLDLILKEFFNSQTPKASEFPQAPQQTSQSSPLINAEAVGKLKEVCELLKEIGGIAYKAWVFKKGSIKERIELALNLPMQSEGYLWKILSILNKTFKSEAPSKIDLPLKKLEVAVRELRPALEETYKYLSYHSRNHPFAAGLSYSAYKALINMGVAELDLLVAIEKIIEEAKETIEKNKEAEAAQIPALKEPDTVEVLTELEKKIREPLKGINHIAFWEPDRFKPETMKEGLYHRTSIVFTQLDEHIKNIRSILNDTFKNGIPPEIAAPFEILVGAVDNNLWPLTDRSGYHYLEVFSSSYEIDAAIGYLNRIGSAQVELSQALTNSIKEAKKKKKEAAQASTLTEKEIAAAKQEISDALSRIGGLCGKKEKDIFGGWDLDQKKKRASELWPQLNQDIAIVTSGLNEIFGNKMPEKIKQDLASLKNALNKLSETLKGLYYNDQQAFIVSLFDKVNTTQRFLVKTLNEAKEQASSALATGEVAVAPYGGIDLERITVDTTGIATASPIEKNGDSPLKAGTVPIFSQSLNGLTFKITRLEEIKDLNRAMSELLEPAEPRQELAYGK